MTGIKSIEINNNISNAKTRSPSGDKFTSRMTRRKQSATWKDRFITIQVFSKQSLQINIKPKARYSEILDQVCSQLGLVEIGIYGLCVKTDLGEYSFLDGSSKVCKRLIDNSSPSIKDLAAGCLLHLRVQYYLEASHNFKSDNDRKFYFQQLKENFLRYGFNYPDDRCFLLASYAIHADELKWSEFDPREYIPSWILKRYGKHFVRVHMPTIAPEHLSPHQAMNTYIKELSTPSPFAYNMRLYKLQSHKTKGSNDTRLGVYPHGLDIYEVNSEGYLSFLSACQWSEITSITANKRRLEILVNDRTMSFYTSNESWCLVLAQFIKNSQSRHFGGHEEDSVLSASSSLDEISFRESYIYSDEFDLEWEYEQSILGTLPGHKAKSINTSAQGSQNRNRFSITSTSTMTSGIVSDRTCLSMENSQEDLLQSSEYATRQSSCDSLLDTKAPYHTKGRTVTVQRAISEPSKKFEQLRLQVRSQPEYSQRRAVSDETVDDHDYENVSVIRKMLEIQMAANRRRTQSSASQQTRSPVISGHSSPIYPNQHTHHPSSSSRKLSVSSASKAVSPLNRYSLISTSPSMEQLLIDYTPPPSYNETHAKQREKLLAAHKNTESNTSLPTATTKVTSHSASNSLTATEPQPWVFQKRQSSMPNGDEEQSSTPISNGIKSKACSCLKLSHPEIDKLRTEVKDMISLPMIAALCNDKELQKCTCEKKEQTTPSSPRPISWHCEMPQTFTFPSSSVLPRQVCH